METLFVVVNFAVMPFWFLMIALPHWRWTRRVMATPWPILVMPLLYTALMIPRLADVMPLLFQFPNAHTMANLLGTVDGVTIGWIHFIAMDLFVGRWAYLDSRERKFSAWWVSPILFLVLMAGPLGLLLYVSVRWLRIRD